MSITPILPAKAFLPAGVGADGDAAIAACRQPFLRLSHTAVIADFWACACPYHHRQIPLMFPANSIARELAKRGMPVPSATISTRHLKLSASTLQRCVVDEFEAVLRRGLVMSTWIKASVRRASASGTSTVAEGRHWNVWSMVVLIRVPHGPGQLQIWPKMCQRPCAPRRPPCQL